MPFFDWVIREKSQPGSVGHFQPAGTFLFKQEKHKYEKKTSQLPTFGFVFSTRNLWHDCWPLSHTQRPLLLEFLRLSNLLQSLAGCQPQRRRERLFFLLRACERGSWKKWSYPRVDAIGRFQNGNNKGECWWSFFDNKLWTAKKVWRYRVNKTLQK